MRIFGSDRLQNVMLKSAGEGVPIEHGMVSRAIARPRTGRGRNFETRNHLLEYYDVMNRTEEIYGLRRDT